MENQDNQQRQDLPLDDSWLDEILNESVAEPTTAKPTDSSSEDIEQLIAETMSQIMEEETQESPYTADEPIVATEEPLADEFIESIETDIDEFITETRNQIQTPSADPQEVPLDATQVIEQPGFKDAEYRDAFGDGAELEAAFESETTKKRAWLPKRKKETPSVTAKLEDFPVE